MSEVIMDCLMCLIYIWMGSANIGDAVESFKKKKYKWFGFHTIMAVMFVELLIIYSLKYR